MYLKHEDQIKVINSIRDIERIRKQQEQISREEWLLSIVGSSCLIGILFFFNHILGA